MYKNKKWYTNAMKKKLLQEKQEIHRGYNFETKSIDKENFTVEGVFSTEDVDRHGEVVMQNGWKLEAYRMNPIVAWAHKTGELPIAKMLNIGVDAQNRLVGKMQFAVNEYPFAKTVFDMIAGGFLNAFSAGFMNEIYQIDQNEDVVILNENELFEVSVVPIPANKLALVKAKGIETELYEKAIEESGYVKQVQFEIPTMTEADAVQVISKSNKETIRSTIATLTELVKDDAEADTNKGVQVDHSTTAKAKVGGKNKVSVKSLNRAIRDLLGVKKSITKK